MSNINSTLNDLIEIINKVNDEYNSYREEVGKLDIMKSDILHLIENKSNMNAAEGYKYSKALQIICRERRVIKNKLAAMKSLMDKTKLNNNSIIDSANNSMKIFNKQTEISNKGMQSYSAKILDLSGSDVLENVKIILNK